jgi:hypothetical protein
MGNLERLNDSREKLCEKLFREIEENEDHKLHGLLPEMNKAVYTFRTIRKYNLPTIRTKTYFKYLHVYISITIFLNSTMYL